MALKMLTLLLFFVHSTSGCTEFIVECTDENQSNIVARTMEWPVTDFGYHIEYLPAGNAESAFLPSNCNPGKGLKWAAKHKILAINALAPVEGIENVYFDGMNDAGVSVGGLYFPGYANYSEGVPDNKCSNAIQHIQVVNYILSTYSSVKELKQALDEDKFPFVYAGSLPVPLPEGTIDFVFPIHWSIVDSSGDAIVLEYTEKEGRRVHINEVGVFTNSPTYDWHTTNLKNYINLQAEEFERTFTRNNVEYNLPPFGHGTGMLGIPGDFTPPSRFIRTASFLRHSKPPATIKDAIIKAWHLINSVDIVKDMINGASDWAVVKDLNNDVMYFRGLTFLGIRTIDMKKLGDKAKVITLDAPFEGCLEDVTNNMEDKEKSKKSEL